MDNGVKEAQAEREISENPVIITPLYGLYWTDNEYAEEKNG